MALAAVVAAPVVATAPKICARAGPANTERKATAEIGGRNVRFTLFTGGERRFIIDLRSPWSSKTQGLGDPFFASGFGRIGRANFRPEKMMTDSSLRVGTAR